MNGKSWSENDIETLRKLYPCRPTREVAEALGCSVSRIYSKAIDLRIAKTQEFLDSPESGRAHKGEDRKSTRLNSSHITRSRMPSSA